MLKILYCLRDQHDWKLVLLGAAVCLISCVVTVLTINRAHDTGGGTRLRWEITSGAATGFGIWATHFIAMLAFNPGVPMAFDPRLTLLSLVCAVLITGGGIHVVVTRGFPGALAVGGAIMGVGICTMHYLGMMALDVPGRLVWDFGIVAASFAAGIGLAAGAMSALALPSSRLGDRLAGLLFVGAIVGHHFTAMGAVTIVPDPRVAMRGLELSPGAMSVAIALAAIAVLGLCTHAVVWGRKLDQVRSDADRRFRILLEGVEDYAICMLDPDGRVMNWNAGGERINGYAPSEIVGRNFAEVCALDADFARRYTEGLKTAAETGRFEIEGPCRRADGEAFWSHTVVRPLHDDDGTLLGFANITQDITERRAGEERILQVSRNLDAALSHMSHGLCLFDRNEKLILANRRFAELYGLGPDILYEGVSFRDLLRHIIMIRDGAVPDEDTVEKYHARHRALLARPEGGIMVSDFFANRTLSISDRPMPDGGFVSTFDDITERRRSESLIAHMARHDGLTGLPNRVHFTDHLDQELARAARHGEQIAVIAIDLDSFKEVNDLHGHVAGDDVLKRLALRMQTLAAGDGKFIARLGGDEFAAIKRFETRQGLDDCMRLLHRCLCEPVTVEDEETITVGASIGIAVYPDDGTMREALLNNADLALQRAKLPGGDKVCYFDIDTDEAARERRLLAKDLERALRDDEFRVFYQVQQTVETGEITGYEALIRWKHPVRGFVSPGEFISAAEESGAIVDIGKWVLAAACAEAATWADGLRVAVNLSPVQLNDVDLIDTVRNVLAATGLKPSRLELEITESTIIADKLRALHILRQIKALGVTIAIDDFGTGYASLDTLAAFPFDKIKIDRSFLNEAGHNPQARAVIRAVLALGRSLNITVLAEGVETQAQLDLLREENCHEAQGYLLGRPVEHIEAATPSARPAIRAAS